MKLKLPYQLILFYILLLSFLSCKKEDNIIVESEKNVFNFIVTESQRTRIFESRGEQYEIVDPIPQLEFEGGTYTLDRFEIRGANTLNFARKSYSINMDRKITLFNTDENKEEKFEEFKLLAMVYDYTYIENSTAFGLLKEAGLWPVYSFFTEVRLNNHTQGLYYFIEDPFEYQIEQKNTSILIRRGYQNTIKKYTINPASLYDATEYIARFKNIYTILPNYSGQQIYDTLSAYMDLEQYFTKLSIDMLIKNGDYTDEVIFYTKIKNDKEIFGVIPWDYDDIFEDQPHEIGRSWAVGEVFGKREYNSMDDIIADVGSKLLFSIEDDLDYKIAKDSVLYRHYLGTLKSVITQIDVATIDKIFDNTYARVSPFYANDSIIAQSRYDVDRTNYDLFISNLADKRQMLKDRREWILQELDKQ
jgi:spore coat protein H